MAEDGEGREDADLLSSVFWSSQGEHRGSHCACYECWSGIECDKPMPVGPYVQQERNCPIHQLVSGYILYLYLLYLTLNSLTCLTSFSGGSKTVTYLTYPNW